MATISELAIIEDGATIDKNVEIGPYCFISQDAVIGEGTVIEQGSCIYGKTSLGKFNHVFSHSVLGSIPQDLKFSGEDVELIIGDYNKIRATLAGHVEMGDYVVIGGMTPVHQFVHIGDFSMIAGASALAQDIPPYCMAEGNRASLRGLNLTGLRRHVQRQDIDALKTAYKELFEMKKPLKDAANDLLESSDNFYVHNICNFILKTKRGIPYERKN